MLFGTCTILATRSRWQSLTTARAVRALFLELWYSARYGSRDRKIAGRRNNADPIRVGNAMQPGKNELLYSELSALSVSTANACARYFRWNRNRIYRDFEADRIRIDMKSRKTLPLIASLSARTYICWNFLNCSILNDVLCIRSDSIFIQALLTLNRA